MLADPYEDLFVYVDESLIPDAGQGLFAKVETVRRWPQRQQGRKHVRRPRRRQGRTAQQSLEAWGPAAGRDPHRRNCFRLIRLTTVQRRPRHPRSFLEATHKGAPEC